MPFSKKSLELVSFNFSCNLMFLMENKKKERKLGIIHQCESFSILCVALTGNIPNAQCPIELGAKIEDCIL